MNLRTRMAEKTANLRSTAEIEPSEKFKTSAPKTAPGIAGALAAANSRIQELESAGVSSELKLADIAPNPWQPRRKFNEAKMGELAESIREIGLMQPIVVRRAGAGYQIIAGERRWRAHKLLEKDAIKAVIIECSDEDMIVLALAENLDRDDLTDYEIAIAIRRSESEFPSRKRLAEALGMSRVGLYQFLAFDNLADFMKQDLDLRPDLLGSNAAEEIASVLKKYGAKAEDAARELWPALLNGDLPQGKFAAAIVALATRSVSESATRERSIEKFFAGKKQAGSITKDVKHFTVKIKREALTEDHEAKLRELVSALYSKVS